MENQTLLNEYKERLNNLPIKLSPSEILYLLVNSDPNDLDLSGIKLTKGEYWELKGLAELHTDIHKSIILGLSPTGANDPMRGMYAPRRDRTKELSILTSYNTINNVPLDKEKRGAGNNFIKLTLNVSADRLSTLELNNFACLFLDKKIEDNYYSKKDVVFMPADQMDYVNTYGLPMYVSEFKEGGCYNYEFETHITTLSQIEHTGSLKSFYGNTIVLS